MLKFLNDLLAQENVWYIKDSVFEEIECEDETLSQFIRKLRKIIKKQRKVLQEFFLKIKEYQNGLLTNDVSTQTDELPHNVLNEQANVNSWKTESVEKVVKEVAEDAMKQTGFVYEATSGLYYDYNTGYYYNAEQGLYYDGNSGTYYYYDKEKNSLLFHSQVVVPQVAALDSPLDIIPEGTNKRRKNKTAHKTKTSKRIKEKKDNYDIEEGECSEDSNQMSDISSGEDCDVNETAIVGLNNDVKISSVLSNEPELDEISKAWPPCMRIIVKETTVKNLQVGTLFIVTCAGGTLGREGNHALLIPDINISKYHAKFEFDTIDKVKEIGNYTLTDLGSRNGTFIDGKRLSTALQESTPHPIPHESTVRVGGTTLLCHVHMGRETCLDCEPGVLIPDKSDKRSAYVSEENLTEKRKKQLKKLKQRFGLSINSEPTSSGTVKYKDRAEIRRQTVGSSSDNFKTEVASVSEPIKKTNKGFKLLSKMGWSEGESLGSKTEDGIREPILVQQRAEKVGLGYDGPVEVELPEVVKKKQELWKKVQDRYRNLE